LGKKVFVGVDGCRAGWFAVFLKEENENGFRWEVALFPEFSFLIDFLENKCSQAEPLILIDIPIGLKNGGTGERLSDKGAREILKSENPASSLFPAGKRFMRKPIKRHVRSIKGSQERASQSRHGT
jgi:predicted RNase H-like nuclease